MNTLNTNGWATVPIRPRRNTVRNNAKTKKAKNLKTRKNQILYEFYHPEEFPDELFTLSLAAPNTRDTTTVVRKPQILDEEEKRNVQRGLVEFFRDGYMKYVAKGEPTSDETILEYINSILIRYDIKISGGFILKNMGAFEGASGSTSIDIDIYLPYNTAKNPKVKRQTTIEIHTLLRQLFDVDMNAAGNPKYVYFKVSGMKSKRASFFQKNGIYAVTKYFKAARDGSGSAEMDLVQADRGTTPIKIIQRFDLSFCQNWYDGENLWSMDKEAIYKRDVGTLEHDYVQLYLDGNPVTRKRILKYMKRGFRVKYLDPTTEEYVEITFDDLRNINT